MMGLFGNLKRDINSMVENTHYFWCKLLSSKIFYPSILLSALLRWKIMGTMRLHKYAAAKSMISKHGLIIMINAEFKQYDFLRHGKLKRLVFHEDSDECEKGNIGKAQNSLKHANMPLLVV